MNSLIKKIEDLSLNAWPSHQMQFYDGWILRYSCFYTHRTNSVEQLGPSTLPMEEKVSWCEDVYRWWQTPCIFKISPSGEPGLDAFLRDRGYRIEHRTTVMTTELSGRSFPGMPASAGGLRLLTGDRVDDEWLSGLFSLKKTVNPDHLRVVPGMYAAIPKDEIAIRVCEGDRIIGTGLGILDRDTVGVYAVHVEEGFRRRGIARAIVGRILQEAAARGIRTAYLQAVTDNLPAQSLYRSLGFEPLYFYYFRLKEMI